MKTVSADQHLLNSNVLDSSLTLQAMMPPGAFIIITCARRTERVERMKGEGTGGGERFTELVSAIAYAYYNIVEGKGVGWRYIPFLFVRIRNVMCDREDPLSVYVYYC
jgi:hypothetical protein